MLYNQQDSKFCLKVREGNILRTHMYNVAVQSALRDVDTRFNDSSNDHIRVHPNIVRKGLASFPGPRRGGEKGLVSTECACA